jgi:alkanesulfonate monooxygenase SsuD/methylene tetrahydromethanopterin reductase-like flavin-dependent oxidoreductase (luciferase family)
MSPFFNPVHPPSGHPHIHRGVNLGSCRLAGETADGFHAHPYHSIRYLTEVVRPAIVEGAARSGRAPQSVSLIVSAFTATDPEQAEQVRSQIAFYASTPSYRPVMALHGWGEIADELQGLARRGEWSAMGGRISQEMLRPLPWSARPRSWARRWPNATLAWPIGCPCICPTLRVNGMLFGAES